MAQPTRQRLTSNVVAQKPGCAPLKAMYDAAVSAKPKTWAQIEVPFLRAMEQFDANVESGVADMGDLQNGKGDFFNDLLALLLENCADVTLWSRGGVPGLIFKKHNLDVSYPSTGTVEFNLEAKTVGTPKHPGSPRQKPIGRRGSADLDKRIKEVGFKAIDLKAEYGRISAQAGASPHGGPGGGSLTTWLRQMKPSYYLFIAARVVSQNDFDAVMNSASIAARVADHVGVYCYTPVSDAQPTTYRSFPVKSAAHELDRILFEACQDLSGIEARRVAATAKSQSA